MVKIGKVHIFSYGEYDDNYGVHALALSLHGIVTIYFSYDTPIAAYFIDERKLYVDTFPYSRTTNKHRGWAVEHAHRYYYISEEVAGDDIDIEELIKHKLGELAPRIIWEAIQ